MIWIFDSGLWGVLTLEYFKKMLWAYDYLYLWDTAFLPWGERDARWIHDRTFACLNWLFLQWCDIVILACNTASAHAIRNRQSIYPHKKVLSITIPGVEAIHDAHFHHVALLATQATIRAGIYQSVASRLFPDQHIQFQTIIGTGLVEAIEAWANDKEIQKLLDPLLSQCSPAIEAIVLGCTHYPLMSHAIQQRMENHFSVSLPLIDPGRQSANQFAVYLDHHPEIAANISTWWTVRYCVTGDASLYDKKIEELFARKVSCEHSII